MDSETQPFRIVRHGIRQRNFISSLNVRQLSLAGMIQGCVGHAYYLESDFPLFDETSNGQNVFAIKGFSTEECQLNRLVSGKQVTFVLVGTKVQDAVDVAIALNEMYERQVQSARAQELEKRGIVLDEEKIRVEWVGVIPRAYSLWMGEKGWTQVLPIFQETFTIREEDLPKAYNILKSAVEALSLLP